MEGRMTHEEMVVSLKSKTGRGTVEVVRDWRGDLVCGCGQDDCEHLVAATLAQSAGVKVVDPEGRSPVPACPPGDGRVTAAPVGGRSDSGSTRAALGFRALFGSGLCDTALP